MPNSSPKEFKTVNNYFYVLINTLENFVKF